MNYLPPTKKHAPRKWAWGVFLRWLALGFLFGVITGCALTLFLGPMASAAKPDFEVNISKVSPEPIFTPAPTPTPAPIPSPEPVRTLLGEYRITAYCGCETCCGQWAANRPEGKVFGAAGVELQPGVSVASPLPFGTTLEIEGLGEYVVQDRIAQWVVDKYNGETVDIYFSDHESACEFGLQYHNVYIVEGTK